MGNIYFGDHSQAFGPNAIGKQVINEGVSEPLAELRALLVELQEAGLVGRAGPAVDDQTLEKEIESRKGRFKKLHKFVSAGGGPTLQNAAGGTMAALIIEAISRLS
jgi:hypothetical protein